MLTFIISQPEREKERKHDKISSRSRFSSLVTLLYTYTDWICIFAFACSLPLSRYVYVTTLHAHTKMSHLTIFLFLCLFVFFFTFFIANESIFCLVWTCSNPIIKKCGQGERYCVILFICVCIRMNKSRHTLTELQILVFFFFSPFFSPKFITQAVHVRVFLGRSWRWGHSNWNKCYRHGCVHIPRPNNRQHL